jgi:hypothetical protein
MKKERDYLFLNHIFDACSQISKYLKNIDYDNFQKNRLIQDAVMRELEIIEVFSPTFNTISILSPNPIVLPPNLPSTKEKEEEYHLMNF